MLNKPHLLFLAALVFILLPVFTEGAHACSCMFGGMQPCQEYSEADAVFAGTVVGISRVTIEDGNYKHSQRLVRFSLEQGFRGIEGSFVEVVTGLGGGDCGYGFKQGGQYLVYARRNAQDKRLYTGICLRTRPLAEAAADLAFIRSLATAEPTGIIFGEVSKRNYEWKEGEDWRKAIAGAELTIEGETARYELKSDAEGAFRMEGLAPGAYKVKLKIPTGLAQLNSKNEFVETVEHEVKVAARGCVQTGFFLNSDTRVSGYVIDAAARPVANLKLDMRGAPSDPKNINTFLSAQTDAEGQFEFKLVPPGDYLLGVRLLSSSGYELPPYPRTYYPGVTTKAQAGIVSVKEGERLPNLELRLPPRLAEYSVEGFVVWEDGRPAPGVSIYVSLQEEGELSSHASLRADERGRFTLKVYEGLSYQVSAYPQGATGNAPQSKWMDVPPRGAQPIKLVLPIIQSNKAKSGRSE